MAHDGTLAGALRDIAYERERARRLHVENLAYWQAEVRALDRSVKLINAAEQEPAALWRVLAVLDSAVRRACKPTPVESRDESKNAGNSEAQHGRYFGYHFAYTCLCDYLVAHRIAQAREKA